MEQDYLKPRGWTGIGEHSPRRIDCGFCGEAAVSHFGYAHSIGNGTRYSQPLIYICANCGCPTFFDLYEEQHPGPRLGREIDNLPDDVQEVYDEIRDSIKSNCNTAAILLGRKLLMHLSVNKADSKANANFKTHIEQLQTKGYVPPGGDKLLEFIRELGNEQNHQIKIGDPDDAEKMLKFIEMMLLFMYEMNGFFEEE